MQPISAQTAATLTTYMRGVVKSGTAAPSNTFRGFPPSWDVAAKTGTAEVGPGLQETTDWLIAFAPAGNTKVAIAVVVPNQAAKQTGAGIAGPIVKKILGDVLGDPNQ
jgi:cell division protein FtsI/penicillin-binding protein 2